MELTPLIDMARAEFPDPGVLPWPVLPVRLCGSLLLCGAVGWEREVSNRPAGLRTHMLAGPGATVCSILTLELVSRPEFPETVRMDPLRIIEAVTGGVAFLAAGMVIFAKGEVRGLTTGAGLWLAAGVGLCCGLGLCLGHGADGHASVASHHAHRRPDQGQSAARRSGLSRALAACGPLRPEGGIRRPPPPRSAPLR
jgi:putative Mg2+ transporter-C (MgtC) family protein